jgi:preprotein translocase SecE subunit
MIGAAITAAIGIAALVWAGRTFFAPSFEKRLLAIEDQGWFNARAYKKSQGLRVRRGTMLGALILVGCGIVTLINHHTLEAGSPNWDLSIPFTQAEVLVRLPGDTSMKADSYVDRYKFREANDDLANFVKVDKKNDSSLDEGKLIPRQDFDEEVKRVEAENQQPPTKSPPVKAMYGQTRFQGVTLLPDVKLTVPLLLAVFALWFAWRLVNYPVFADFLIATEAELNKVSWTTRKRLVQDTIVVLVTVVFFTLFLLIVDVAWGKLLAWKYIGVLRIDTTTQQEAEEELRF